MDIRDQVSLMINNCSTWEGVGGWILSDIYVDESSMTITVLMWKKTTCGDEQQRWYQALYTYLKAGLPNWNFVLKLNQ